MLHRLGKQLEALGCLGPLATNPKMFRFGAGSGTVALSSAFFELNLNRDSESSFFL